MLRKCFIIGLAILFVAGCSSKPKPVVEENAAMATDGSNLNQADVQNRDLSLDPCGSDCGAIPGLTTVNFAYDSSTLNEEAKSVLARNAEWIKSNPAVSLQIEGHCDSRGSDEYNRSLGSRRAEVVKSYLQGLGIDVARVSTMSWGEEKLLVLGDTDADNAKNRRANFAPIK